MKLFDNKLRIDTKPAKHFDNTYDFYDRSNLELAEKIRFILNEWFEKYPNEEKNELKTRFRNSFSSAFFELFIHALFTAEGFTLIPHPQLPKSSKRPDFLAVGHNLEFYIEAKEVTDKSDLERAEDNRLNNFYDKINTINSPNFFIRFKELLLKNTNSPNSKKIFQFLEKEINKFDPDIQTEKLERTGLNGTDSIYYEDEEVKLEITLIPKSEKIRGKEGILPIGMYPFSSSWGGADESIKKAIEKKAKKYGTLDKPYLICINSISEKTTDDYAVMNALFGSLQFTFSTNPEDRDEKVSRAFDGLFTNSKEPKFTRVSGIFITNVYTTNLHVAKHWLVKHPFSAKDLSFNIFKLNNIVVKDNQIVTNQGLSIREIFKLPLDWISFK